MSDDYNLKLSGEAIGQLYPVLLDGKGNVIDGVERFKADPNWRKEILDHIDTELKRVLARLTVNGQRRNLEPNEAEMLVSQASKLLIEAGVEKGELAKTIRELTGWSTRWILMYMPEEFKHPNKVKAGKISAETRRSESEAHDVRHQMVPVEQIVIDQDVRPRLGEGSWIARQTYYHAMRAGRKFPPIVLGDLDGSFILLDGFHRLRAKKQLGHKAVLAEIERISSKSEAFCRAVELNSVPQLPLSLQEMTRNVDILERSGMSDNDISGVTGIPP